MFDGSVGSMMRPAAKVTNKKGREGMTTSLPCEPRRNDSLVTAELPPESRQGKQPAPQQQDSGRFRHNAVSASRNNRVGLRRYNTAIHRGVDHESMRAWRIVGNGHAIKSKGMGD